MSDRENRMREFLQGTNWAEREPVFLAGDASARQYFRLPGQQSAVLMDAPPRFDQQIMPFVKIAELLCQNGFHAPEILARDEENGFLLLEDFGDGVFARVVEDHPEQEDKLYLAALNVLLCLEQTKAPVDIPTISAREMAQMIEPAFTWYRWALRGERGDPEPVVTLLQAKLSSLLFATLCLRDFHAENLVWQPEQEGIDRVCLLDFQDAFIGPAGYDLVSLLLDARRDVAKPVLSAVQQGYAERSGRSVDEVDHVLALLGLQRNLRILGIFTRLALRDGKPRYLDFLPRVWRYVVECSAHPHLSKLAKHIERDIPAPTPTRIQELRARCGTVPDR